MTTPAQYAQLCEVLGNKRTADVLIEYIASQVAPAKQYVDAVLATAPTITPTPYASSVTRPFDTDFIVSSTRDALVSYTVELFVPVTLAAGTVGADVTLTVDGVSAGNGGADTVAVLALGLSLSPKHRKTVTAYVKAGSTARLVTSLVGSGTATYLGGQETLL